MKLLTRGGRRLR